MSVKRYTSPDDYDSLATETEYVLASDYDALEARIARLEGALRATSRSWC